MDAAHEPAFFYLGSAWDGNNTIWMLRGTGPGRGTGAYEFHPFDLVSGTWQPASSSVAAGIYSFNFVSIVFLTTGKIRVFYTPDADNVTFTQPTLLKFLDYDPVANTWAAPVTLLNLGVGTGAVRLYAEHQPLSFLDSSVIDVSHLWYDAQPTHGKYAAYIRVAADGSTSAPYTAPANPVLIAGAYGAYGHAIFDAATNSLVKPFSEFGSAGGSGYSVPVVFRGTPLENPLWYKEYVVNPPSVVIDSSSENDLHYTFRAVDGKQVSAWISADVSDPAHQWDQFTCIRTAFYKGPLPPPAYTEFGPPTVFGLSEFGNSGIPDDPTKGWSTPAILYSAIANPYADAALTDEPLLEYPYWIDDVTSVPPPARRPGIFGAPVAMFGSFNPAEA
jgi:hypothetical protein